MNTDRVVIITGAAGGIGSELVDRFLSNGDTVIATDVSDSALGQWRTRWDTDAQTNPRLIVTAVDIASEESCRQLADRAREQTGRVDVLINCAGWFPFVSFEEMTTDQWRQVIDINLTGTFLMTKVAVPLMKNRGWGRIVNFGSGSLFDGTANQSHYVAAKAGVLGFSRSLARELGDYGITVNVVTPGLTVTKAVKDTFAADILEAQRSRRAIHRDEVADDLVGPVFFLASDDAGFITGQTLNVDGGQHLL
jgi:NAD(P)-dependent dehydrogenase (short-subunit alcohol dehydrogenase family)